MATESLTQTASDRVYTSLRSMVMTGELLPGDRLVRRHLAKLLGVSPIPILEAIRRLEHDGLVQSLSNCGAQVKQWTPEDIEGAYLAREALEGMAARLFVERATEVDKGRLRELCKQIEDAISEGDLAACLEADVNLHRHIVHCTGSSTLCRLVESSCILTTSIRNSRNRKDGTFASKMSRPKHHDKLVKALLGGDPDRAEEEARAHIRFGKERFFKNCK